MKAGGAKGTPDPERDASVLRKLRQEGEAIDKLDRQLSRFRDWAGHATDPDAVHGLWDLGKKVRAAVGKLADDAEDLTFIRGKVRNLLHDGNDLLAPDAGAGRAIRSFLSALEELHQSSSAFEAVAGQSVRERFSSTDRALNVIQDTADAIASRHAELHDWCGWRRRRQEALDLDLGPLVDAIEKGHVPTDEIPDTFEAAYCTWWSGAVIGEDEVLRTFSTPEHVAKIEQFRDIDSKFQELTARYIEAKLSGNLPDSDSVKRNSSWGTLRRLLQQKRPRKTVRQMIQEMPDVLTTLTPCLMMSPLSVAQYLPPDQELFDVVIFDEASQITVWDAVGALARGRQAIIAGDPKQMPPTNFFARSDDDPDGDVDVEGDLESILDEMLGASIPECILNLHYRSRRESLIAFSNNKYYDNSLITFPAPVHPDRGVRLVRPAGYYARGKARHNEGEAKAIVAEIVRRLTHDDPDVKNRSVGVVTFNSEQQRLIENLLDETRSKRPEIEWAFSTDTTHEPVFVKNLETVQGDERDVILFSITYGPDQSGHVTMNFGPLNRDGGERRLNVAMTRARSEMVVFSTLDPDRIDLSRTQARAVRDLKHFLEYAERGPSALASAVYGSIGDFESPFEEAVARCLRDKGWDIHPQVGVSAYRIDLGILHPDEPGIYLAGVECDGAMYHSSAYARERDKIRQSVLEGLGWTLFRVWSTDWWTNKAGALEKLDTALREHLEQDRQRRGQARIEAKSLQDAEAAADELFDDEDPIGEEPVRRFAGRAENNDMDRRIIHEGPEELELDFPNADQDAPQLVEVRPYEVASLDDFEASPDAFYDEIYESDLSEMIRHVIDTEGPIHGDILVRRIARHHGFKRAGRQIREVVLGLANNLRSHSAEDVGNFYWPEGMYPGRIVPARYKGRDDETRKPEFICQEEIQAIAEELGVKNDPVELARQLGIVRLSQSARKRFEDAMRNEM